VDACLYDDRDDKSTDPLTLTEQDNVWAVLLDFHY
jgi:hypothetical protein